MRSIQVFAYDIATSFDLPLIRQQADSWGKVLEKDPLVCQLAEEKYLVIFDYGSVVFFGFSTQEVREQINNLKKYANRANRREFVNSFALHIGNRIAVSTEEMVVSKFMLDVVKLVAIVLSRSVGLEYYEDLIERNLAKIEEAVDKLSHEGRLVGSRRELVKQVGLALAVNHELAYNLGLLDEPEIVWDRGAEMQKIYQHLTSAFAIQRRAQTVERKLDIIAKSSQFIIDRLQDRTANLLEYGIIFLFVVDLILLLMGLAK
ncbi:MAG: RMD1 family protein [Patescibacteria group bacterium]